MGRRQDVVMLGTGRYLPERVLSNEDLECIVDTTNDWILDRTGVSERRIAGPGEGTSDMAVAAAISACLQAQIDPAELDLIIVASVTGETHFPATACWVQGKLGNKLACAFDLSIGCAGFIYALQVATSMMQTGRYEHALVVGADRVSGIADYTDRQSCILFGDGAGAVVLGLQPGKRSRRGLLGIRLHSDGSKAGMLFRPLDAVASPDRPAHASPGSPYLYMEGRSVYRHAVQSMESAVREVLQDAKLTLVAVDWIVPHQANLRIIETLASRLGVDWSKVYVNIPRYGNTSAASIPICLDEMNRSGLLQAGQRVVLCTFGTGFTWGSCLLSWGT